MIRLLIADDHPVVRDGLRGMLAGQPDFEVVGEAGGRRGRGQPGGRAGAGRGPDGPAHAGAGRRGGHPPDPGAAARRAHPGAHHL